MLILRAGGSLRVEPMTPIVVTPSPPAGAGSNSYASVVPALSPRSKGALRRDRALIVTRRRHNFDVSTQTRRYAGHVAGKGDTSHANRWAGAKKPEFAP